MRRHMHISACRSTQYLSVSPLLATSDQLLACLAAPHSASRTIFGDLLVSTRISADRKPFTVSKDRGTADARLEHTIRGEGVCEVADGEDIVDPIHGVDLVAPVGRYRAAPSGRCPNRTGPPPHVG